jgi:hypothetical protein
MFNEDYINNVLADEYNKASASIYRNDHKTFVDDAYRHWEIIKEHLQQLGLINYEFRYKSYNLIEVKFNTPTGNYMCRFRLDHSSYSISVLENEMDRYNNFESRKQYYSLFLIPSVRDLPIGKKYHKEDLVLYNNTIHRIIDYRYETEDHIFYELDTNPIYALREDSIISLEEGI